MDSQISGHSSPIASIVTLTVCVLVAVVAQMYASGVQTDSGRVAVSNVVYTNDAGRRVRAKLFKPIWVDAEHPAPGVAMLHGYQSVRENNDPFALEMARRGIVVLSADALGRGNSDMPGTLEDSTFDHTYGGMATYRHLASLAFVDSDRIGLLGHSLGGQMMFDVAMQSPAVRGLVLTGTAYTEDATVLIPTNMLMIFGAWDEFRPRMTGTTDFEKEWMRTPVTRQVMPVDNPEFGVTYGSFADGTARRVYAPRTIHVLEMHHEGAVREALVWMRQALQPDPQYWLDEHDQIWHSKDYAQFLALIACFGLLLPLASLLLRLPFFRPLARPVAAPTVCSRATLVRAVSINTVLEWLLLPLALVLFAIHVYVVPIDRLFPLMVVNAITFWFVLTNLIGLWLFLRWYRRLRADGGPDLCRLGLSDAPDGLVVSGSEVVRTLLLGIVLFGVVYAAEHVLESAFVVDLRYIFSYANDLTPRRWLLALQYAPLLFIGFIGMGVFLYGQLRLRPLSSPVTTCTKWSAVYVAVVVLPLVVLLAVQYVPLLLVNRIPLVGPGGMLTLLTINVFHIVGVLMLIIPVSTWLFLRTGRPWLGALVNALLVAWMFAGSQVVAPMPVGTG